MSTEFITSSLKDIFNSPLKDGEIRKIVYWEDLDRAFEETFKNIEIDNVKKHILYENNYFKTKYLLEVEDSKSNYLIYTQEALEEDNIEENNDNWLLDNILYSTVFYADEISMYCRELEIPAELRKVVSENRKFFRNQNRREKFRSYNINNFSEEIIEEAIISVLTDQKISNFEDSIRTILTDNLIDEENGYLKKIDSFFDANRFWRYLSDYYGYEGENKSLKGLLIHLMINALSTLMSSEKLEMYKDLLTDIGKTNCAVFIDRWMNHKTDYKKYDSYAKNIEDEILFSRVLQSADIDDIKIVDIFPSVDQAIILYILDALEHNLEDYDEYGKLLRLRKTKHFYEKYREIYEGLYYTIKMFEFRKLYPSIPIELPYNMVKSYVDRYYLMDLYYRKFYVAYDKFSNNSVLQKLRNMIEGLYVNWFMMDLSYNWSETIEKNLGDAWNIPNVTNQNEFYYNFIKSKINNKERVFVVISDALRYEVATELCERLDADSLGSTELKFLISGLPSTTKFGMARLLPHNKMELRDSGFIYSENINSGTMDGRKQILSAQTAKSTAIDYNGYMDMDKNSLREFYKGNILNYIYHDTIDAIGDDSSTEIKAFDGVEMAMDELMSLINSLKGNLSATNIYITSDHGFIYQRNKLEEVDKIAKEKFKTVESKRRYILSEEIKTAEGLLRYPVEDVSTDNSKLNVYIPKANIRFKTQGAGANFVHGGAALQEIVIPLIFHKNKVAGQTGAVQPKKTQIKVTDTSRRITNSIFTLNFFQTEKVGGKIIPCTVKVYMVSYDNEIISNEEILLGDKTSESPKDRNMAIRFILKSMDYDKNKDYYLIIKDEQTGIEYDRIPFTINLGIVSDFDF